MLRFGADKVLRGTGGDGGMSDAALETLLDRTRAAVASGSGGDDAGAGAAAEGQGRTFAHFRAQLEDLREHTAHERP